MQFTTPQVDDASLKNLVSLLLQELQSVPRKPEETILTEDQVMEILDISSRTLKYMKSRREITFTKWGGRSYFILSDILRHLQERRVEAVSISLKKSKNNGKY